MRVCECGCGRPLSTKPSRRSQRWASNACVPKTLRQVGGRKGGKTQAKARNVRMFFAELRRLEACRPMTREDLLASFATIYRKGYHAGQMRRMEREAA